MLKKDISKALDRACSVLDATHETAIMDVIKSEPRRKLYWVFDANWFIRFGRGTIENESFKGWEVCGILAFLLSVVIIGLLW